MQLLGIVFVVAVFLNFLRLLILGDDEDGK
jgi:hypothetical protein